MQKVRFCDIKEIISNRLESPEKLKAFREYHDKRVYFDQKDQLKEGVFESMVSEIKKLSDLSLNDLEGVYDEFNEIQFTHTQHNRRAKKTVISKRTINNYLSYNNCFLDNIIEEAQQNF